MANRRFQQFFNTLHNYPVLLDCNFVVDVANGNGLGVRSLKGPGIAQVFGHTSATPAVFNGVTNNVPVGHFQIFLSDAYNRVFSGMNSQVSPVSGTPILVTTGTTQGTAYIIVSVGTTSTAQWQKLGLPNGVVPAVGAAFIAKATTTATGTGAIEIAHANGTTVGTIETVGDPNLTISMPDQTTLPAANPYIIVRNMSGATPVVTAVRDESVLSISLYLSNTRIQAAGE